METPQIWLKAVDSTNTVAWRLWEAGYRRDTWVVALTQSAGVGRRGSKWASPLGGLWASRLLSFARPLPMRSASWLGLALALATARAVEEVSRVTARVKWPNDVVVGGRKLAGVLVETRGVEGQALAAVAGVGLNVNVRIADLPPALRHKATSLYEETGERFSLRAVLLAVERAFLPLYRSLLRGEYIPLAAQARQRLLLIDEPVLVVGEDGAVWRGRFAGLDDDGRLVLDTGAELLHFGSDQVHLRTESASSSAYLSGGFSR
ncbi:MAG: biotin--[acetyl-CoA-carboxylase] ligase [Limnochordales bacterium]|nr:biotin--[acetyl-CoA-carboxylase] ligase [Limnochordales bacterium]